MEQLLQLGNLQNTNNKHTASKLIELSFVMTCWVFLPWGIWETLMLSQCQNAEEGTISYCLPNCWPNIFLEFPRIEIYRYLIHKLWCLLWKSIIGGSLNQLTVFWFKWLLGFQAYPILFWGHISFTSINQYFKLVWIREITLKDQSFLNMSSFLIGSEVLLVW